MNPMLPFLINCLTSDQLRTIRRLESVKNLKSMNFEHLGGNTRGSGYNDTFVINDYGIKSGFIDGREGYDEVLISDRKNNWDLNKSGNSYFLTKEVNGIYKGTTREIIIQLQDIEEITFMDGSEQLSAGSGQSEQNNSGTDDKYNDIKGTKKDDVLTGTSRNDALNGKQGDDTLYGGGGDDIIYGHKGQDFLHGGAGHDLFCLRKKHGKGDKNWDWIKDFEVGIDAIAFLDNGKKIRIDNFEGHAILVKGKYDVIAVIEGAAGQIAWGDNLIIA